jgi:predicted MPP superfamily phosphohydrolase
MRVSRRAVLKGLAAGGLGAVIAPAGYGYVHSRHQLGVTRDTLPVDGLPDGLSGLKIGLLTDIHRSQWVSEEDVRRAVQLLLAEQPDLVVLGGDYVTWGDRAYVDRAAHALAGLKAPHGVFGIVGNHDDDHDMPAALVRQGVEMLKDERTRLKLNGETVDLVGIRFWITSARFLALPRGPPSCLHTIRGV